MEQEHTHMLIAVNAFRAFDLIADMALRHGGVEAMRVVQAFLAAARPYTPPQQSEHAETRS